MVRLALSLALVVVVVGAGCRPADVETPPVPGLFPRVAHSGLNKNATFKVMFATNVDDPQWVVGDPTIATIAPAAPPTIEGTDVSHLHFALLTTTGVGETTISARSGGTMVTVDLLVKEYTDEQLAVGKARYETPSQDPARPPCASCHAKKDGVDHSPLKMSGFDDATILGVIQDATYPAVPTGQSAISAFSPRGPLNFPGHKWNLTDAEKDGILAHLRSLPLAGL